MGPSSAKLDMDVTKPGISRIPFTIRRERRGEEDMDSSHRKGRGGQDTSKSWQSNFREVVGPTAN